MLTDVVAADTTNEQVAGHELDRALLLSASHTHFRAEDGMITEDVGILLQ